MKKIIAVSIFCLSAFICITQDRPDLDQLAQHHVDTMQSDGSVTNAIKLLASSGKICEIINHRWAAGRVGEYEPGTVYADSNPNVAYRHCTICNATQSQYVNWK